MRCLWNSDKEKTRNADKKRNIIIVHYKRLFERTNFGSLRAWSIKYIIINGDNIYNIFYAVANVLPLTLCFFNVCMFSSVKFASLSWNMRSRFGQIMYECVVSMLKFVYATSGKCWNSSNIFFVLVRNSI